MSTKSISTDPSREKQPIQPNVFLDNSIKQYAASSQIAPLQQTYDAIEQESRTDPHETEQLTASEMSTQAMKINLDGLKKQAEILQDKLNLSQDDDNTLSQLQTLSKKTSYTQQDSILFNTISEKLQKIIKNPNFKTPSPLAQNELTLALKQIQSQQTSAISAFYEKNKISDLAAQSDEIESIMKNIDKYPPDVQDKIRDTYNTSKGEITNVLKQIYDQQKMDSIIDNIDKYPKAVQNTIRHAYNNGQGSYAAVLKAAGGKEYGSVGPKIPDPEADETLEKRFSDVIFGTPTSPGYMRILDDKLQQYVDNLTFDNTAVGWFNDIASKSLDFDSAATNLNFQQKWNDKFKYVDDGGGVGHYELNDALKNSGANAQDIANGIISDFYGDPTATPPVIGMQTKVYQEAQSLVDPVNQAIAYFDTHPPVNDDQRAALANLQTIKDNLTSLLTPGSDFDKFSHTRIENQSDPNNPTHVNLLFYAPMEGMENQDGIKYLNDKFTTFKDNLKNIDDTTKASLDKFNNVTDHDQLMLQQVFTEVQQIWSIISTCLQILNESIMAPAKGIKGV